MIFNVVFAALCLLCAALCLLQHRTRNVGEDAGAAARDHVHFQRCYLAVYVCAVLGDWLQGPYVYALYANYGFSKQQIALLFIIGFAASGILGVFVGQAADTYGRRRLCCVYCLTYIVSCLSKHSANFHVLVFGRLTGGMATSILFSAFESWLVAAHDARCFPRGLLSQTLSLATLLNSAAALAAAWLGALVVASFDSLVAPFDLAILFLVLALAGMVATWTENKGDAAPAAGGMLVHEALAVLKRDRAIVLLGLVQSCFEAAMYIFVFMWTPKLEALIDDLPHGQVFGCFMACCMIGASLVDPLIKLAGSPTAYLREHLLFSALCLALPAVVPSSGVLAVTCFFAFEIAVGVWWPSIGIIKSHFVPEHVRATIYNLNRVPLNLIVVVVLANLGSLSDDAVLCLCGLLLAAAALFQHLFVLQIAVAGSAPSAGATAPAHPHGEMEGRTEEGAACGEGKADGSEGPRELGGGGEEMRVRQAVPGCPGSGTGLESVRSVHASSGPEAGQVRLAVAESDDEKGTSRLLPLSR